MANVTFSDDHAWFKQLFDSSPDPTWIIAGNRFIECNDAAVKALGYRSRDDLMNVHPSRLSPPVQPDGEDSFGKAERMMDTARQNGLHRFEWVHTRADGSDFLAEVTLSHLIFADQDVIYCVWRDITDRKQAELRLRETEQHFRTLANGGSTLIWTSGEDKLCNYFNEPWLRFTGRALEQELGSGWTEGVHPDDVDDCLNTYMTCFERRQPFSMEYRIRRADGVYRWIRDDGNPRYDSKGAFLGYIGFCVDVSDQKEAEEKIRSLAFYDSLTGLPNRRLLHVRLEKALAASSRHGREGALLFIDLDNFKVINDSLGHDFGDLLLQAVARRLEACSRAGDTVSRLGGDEFVLLLEYLDEDPQLAFEQAQSVGNKILQALGQPYDLQGQVCISTPSIGVALFNGTQRTGSDLIKEADLMMYMAKRDGRNKLRMSPLR